MGFVCNMLADLAQMQLHGFGVGCGKHQGSPDATPGTDRTEKICVLIALISRQAWSRAFPGPNANPPVLLADPRFVLKPQLDRLALWQICYMGCKRVGKVFLKVSMTSAFCAGCRGRPEM